LEIFLVIWRRQCRITNVCTRLKKQELITTLLLWRVSHHWLLISLRIHPRWTIWINCSMIWNRIKLMRWRLVKYSLTFVLIWQRYLRSNWRSIQKIYGVFTSWNDLTLTSIIGFRRHRRRKQLLVKWTRVERRRNFKIPSLYYYWRSWSSKQLGVSRILLQMK